MTGEERGSNPGLFAPRNTFGKGRYAGYLFGAKGKGHKPKPHQVLTVKPR